MALALRKLGKSGPSVSAVGLGCMGMSGMYGPSDDVESIATIHAALDAGINLLDTGDFYGMGHNESLLAMAIGGRRQQAVLSVKFGAMRSPRGVFIGVDARPQAVKNFLSYSLQRLKTDYIDIYRLARLDPAVPIEETVGAMAELVKTGHVRYIGLSEVSASTLRRAQGVAPICDAQNEYSLISRGVEREILPAARELGIGITAYGVLSRGLLTGSRPASRLDLRLHLPRFATANLGTNSRLIDALDGLAAEKGVNAAQLAIAWAMHKGTDIVPLVGARTRKQLADVIAAAEVKLSDDEITRIEWTFQNLDVAGTRYDNAQMRMLDSER